MQAIEIILWLLILSASNLIVLGLFGARFYRTIPAALPLTLFMLVTASLAILQALDISTASLPMKILLHNVRFLFLPYLTLLSLWIILLYVGKRAWIRRDLALLALIIPVSTTLLAITSPFHTLFRYNFTLDTTGTVAVLRYSESMIFPAYAAYNLFLTFLALAILVRESYYQRTLTESRTLLLLAAVAIPTITNYLWVAGVTPVPGVNLSALVFWIPGVLFTIVIFRYGFFDIIPVARKRIIETLSAPILVLDSQGRIIDINPAARALFPDREGPLTGQRIEDVSSDWPELHRFCTTREAARQDLVRPEGPGMQVYSGSVDLLRNPDGAVTARLILLQDITGRKRAETDLRLAYEQISAAEEELRGQYDMLAHNEQQIRESEEKYRAVVTWANDGIAIIQDGVFRFVNPKATGIIGGEAAEFISRPFLSCIHPRERDRLEDLYRRRMNGEAVPTVYETTFLKKSGEPVEVELNAGIISYEGRAADLIYIRDITERKRAQKALEQAKKKLNLLNYVTFNDLQNQIFTLSGYQQLAVAAAKESGTRLLPILEKEIALLQKITDSLRFARTYQDLGLKPAKWQNVNHVFLLAISHLEFQTIRHSVTTGTLEIYCDPLLEQVFQILADNTLTHSETGTLVTIGCSPMPDESLTVFFEDNGTGIPDTLKDRIFLPEFQKKKAVGLFLAREILDITGISLRETGIFGKGARFEMNIPKGAFRFS